MATTYGKVSPAVVTNELEAPSISSTRTSIGFDSVKLASAMRIVFGGVFLFDGMLKWSLFYQGQMQGIIQGYGFDYLSNNWVMVGALVGVGETLAGTALIVGLFQRPAALAGAGIMTFIWGYGNYAASGNVWGYGTGYTDPGGDLMLAMVFGALVFAPAAYGLASYFHLRERWGTSSVKDALLRFFVA